MRRPGGINSAGCNSEDHTAAWKNVDFLANKPPNLNNNFYVFVYKKAQFPS